MAGNHTRAQELCERVLAAGQKAPLEARVLLAALKRRAGDRPAAEAILSLALQAHPDHPVVLNELAVLAQEAGQVERADAFNRRALESAPRDHDARNTRACLLGRRGRLDEAIDELMQLCAEARETGFAHAASAVSLTNLGFLLCQRGAYDQALPLLRQAVAVAPLDPGAHFNLALALLLRGDFEEGWVEYEWRFGARGVPRPERDGRPAWNGRPGPRSILLSAEQGLGDALQFIRLAPLVREIVPSVLVECDASQISLLARTPGIDGLVARGDAADLDVDVVLPLLSVPRVLGITPDRIPAPVPYLFADPADVRARRLEGDFKVGLVWQGNPRHENDLNRSCRLEDFLPLRDIPGLTVYSLAVDATTDAVADIWRIREPGRRPRSFDESAAILENLHLIVSVDTAVVHLAGGLGRPVWTLLPFHPDWRWLLARETSPWYPSMRLFRQTRIGDWRSVIARLAGQLAHLLAPPIELASGTLPAPSASGTSLAPSASGTLPAPSASGTLLGPPASEEGGGDLREHPALSADANALRAPRPVPFGEPHRAVESPHIVLLVLDAREDVGGFPMLPLGEEAGLSLLRPRLPAQVSLRVHPISEVSSLTGPLPDLAVVGSGGVLPFLAADDALLNYVRSCPAVLGLFGLTAAHAERIRPFLESLTTWFARTREDLFLHGRGLRDARYGGPWRICAVPPFLPTRTEVAEIGSDALRPLGRDLAARLLGSFERVATRDADVLLAALCSARAVCWKGSPEEVRGVLLDVLGRIPEEQQGGWMPLDRASVLACRGRGRRALDEIAHWVAEHTTRSDRFTTKVGEGA